MKKEKFPMRVGTIGKDVNLYKCNHCGRVMVYKSKKKWIKSICGGSSDKSVRLMKVVL